LHQEIQTVLARLCIGQPADPHRSLPARRRRWRHDFPAGLQVGLEGIVFELLGLVDPGFPGKSTVEIALNQTGLASGF
jgi:hypothetical protein